MRLTNAEITSGINADEHVCRKSDETGREVFSDGSGGLLQQLPGQNPQPFEPTQDDLDANDWVLVSGLGSDVADEVLSIAHLLRDIAGVIEDALDHPTVDQTLPKDSAGLALMLLQRRNFLPQSFLAGITEDETDITICWHGAQPTPEGV